MVGWIFPRHAGLRVEISSDWMKKSKRQISIVRLTSVRRILSRTSHPNGHTVALCRGMSTAVQFLRPASPHIYPLRSQLNYRIRSKDGKISTGSGWSIHLSSRSVLFEADGVVPELNMLVELSIPWPVRLENRIELQLHLTGRTTGVSNNQVTVEVSGHEFRTRASHTRAACVPIMTARAHG